MATNHTTNYNLNLWEPTDKFIREEFNENTRKIDTALHGLAQSKASVSTTTALQNTLNAHATRLNGLDTKSASTLIRTSTVNGTPSSFTVSLSGIDWSQWDRVELRVSFTGTGAALVRPNGQQNGVYCYSSGMSTSTLGMLGYLYSTAEVLQGTVVLYPYKDQTRRVNAFVIGPPLCFGYCESLKYSALYSISFAAHGNLSLTGGKVDIYGIR